MASSLVAPYSPYAAPLVTLAALTAVGVVMLFERVAGRLKHLFHPDPTGPAPVRAAGALHGGYVYMLRCTPGPGDPYYGGQPVYALGQGSRHPRLEAERARQQHLFDTGFIAPGPWARCTHPGLVMQVVAGVLSERHVDGPMFLISEDEFARALHLALFLTPGARLVEASFALNDADPELERTWN